MMDHVARHCLHSPHCFRGLYLTEMRMFRLAPWVSEQTTRCVPLLRGQKTVSPDFAAPI